nr:unnamed protein product [Digitaria exilis]
MTPSVQGGVYTLALPRARRGSTTPTLSSLSSRRSAIRLMSSSSSCRNGSWPSPTSYRTPITAALFSALSCTRWSSMSYRRPSTVCSVGECQCICLR